MNVMKKMKINLSKLLFLPLLAVLIFAPAFTRAATQAELDALRNKLNATKQQTTTKQKQAEELKTQVAIVDSQIGQAESAIGQTQGQISDTNKSISVLEKKIMDEQSNLDREQEKMSQILASWYMEGESGLLEAIVGADSLSEVMDKQQYYESLRQQIQINTERIQKIRDDLSKQKDEQSNQLQVLNGLKQDQQDQQNDLEDKKSFKNRLLTDTTNTLSTLKTQETELKRKIDEMAAQLSAAYTGGVRFQGGDVLPSIDGSWYQTQLGNYTRLGGSPYANVNVHNYGCYITSLAMMASYYNHRITNTDIATRIGIFNSGGYLMGFNSPGLGIKLGPLQRVDRTTLNSELDNGYPVIASVRLDNFRVHPNVDGSDHFIVIKSRSGNTYYMHDPAQGRGYRFSDIVSIKTVRP